MKINNDTSTIELYPGLFNVFFIGGFYVKLNKDFKIDIINTATNEKIAINEKFLKFKTYKNGIKAINYFNFIIQVKGNYTITVNNFEDLVAKKSMLWSKRIFQKTIDLDNLEILIEHE
jgi:uncharacterized protein YfbU (UPF0304 family)